MKQVKLFMTTLFVILGLCANLQIICAQNNTNTITFDNQSQDLALVKLMGPIYKTIDIPMGQSLTVNIAAGEYYILVRYGNNPDQYSYSKGDTFTVHQTSNQYSAITITLHKVIGGNYPIRTASQEEFEMAQAITSKLWPEAIPIRPGNNLAEITKQLGDPTRITVLEYYSPQLITEVFYEHLGITVNVHTTNGVYKIILSEPWPGDIFGVQIGSSLEDVEKEQKLHTVQSYDVRMKDHPGWSFSVT